MRAKRSKKYRKIMQSYTLSFGFREPYQVFVDSAFLRTCHAFHMPLQKYLENTLHGKARLFLTKCSLAKMTKDHEKSGEKTNRPYFLPPPTEVPLYRCKHNDEETIVPEWQCLVDLIGGQPKGNEIPKNRNHYILATADSTEKEQRAKSFVDVRERVRAIPGVPIVYVKRSVMILEELSGKSEVSIKGHEREKFREGLIQGGSRKRKRGEGGDSDGETENDPLDVSPGEGLKKRGMKKAKGPNPLSIMKKKSKQQREPTKARGEYAADGIAVETKAKRRRKHGGKSSDLESLVDGGGELTVEHNIMSAHARLQEALGSNPAE